MSAGRLVPVHASGGGVVKDCIVCGLPYAIHDHAKDNWLACPSRDELVKMEAELEERLLQVTKALAKVAV